MLKKKIHRLLFVFLSSSMLNAQEYNCELLSRVVNVASGFPVYYATVKLSGTNQGVIADQDGQFRLPCDLELSNSIVLSAIGYETKAVKIDELQRGEINIIHLKPHVQHLETVSLTVKKKKSDRKLPARLIVSRAIKNIPINYPKLPYSYIGYYRDYQQPIGDSYARIKKQHQKNANYINLNESIVEVFDAGFNTDYFENESNQALVYSYNQNETFVRDQRLAIPYDNNKKKYLNRVFIPPFGGNEFNVLNVINSIRNRSRQSFSFADVFSKDFTKNHSFNLQGVTYLNDTPIYEISFVSNASVSGKDHFAKGTIFVAKDTYSIHRLQYGLYSVNKKAPMYEVTIEYVPVNNKMYLNYITFNNEFKASSDHYFKIKEISFDPRAMFFDIHFNNELDEKSIHPVHKKFKIVYGEKEENVIIDDISVLKDRLRLFVDKKQLLSMPDFKFRNLSEAIDVQIKNVKDTDGKLLNRIPKFVLYQYRELFVQEVFPEKKILSEGVFMDKYLPLSKSHINSFDEQHKYWINTPLKGNEVVK
ncbi:carboxypeptidase-like regulatory domain-containing protein [Aquimarina sp. U1-2]|uniref:carboxypeptidase-like regulatory domain-containing protein n=1 Tax=Aquimarina sp. U1-2 TaxID=2823141 RepID=UPI001AECE4EB|nr:carboxypeptidase-like regulatory domain-containing protein [Aquimarina sp. U1-2]MBP2830627.1 carboxypeptidase-like regulatory domain-containing protein [Aquimarina sp. U1-2]